ncbi:MAG: hypothetical protein H0V70_21015 [Ktedonobacteraceae bacterium]|nr:hypothetical protein [Ktedonobacteraceae bacterium]
MQESLKKTQANTAYDQKEAQLARLGERQTPQEVSQLKKMMLALQRQVVRLEDLLARCTYEGLANPTLL